MTATDEYTPKLRRIRSSTTPRLVSSSLNPTDLPPEPTIGDKASGKERAQRVHEQALVPTADAEGGRHR
ncbi:hypothetical protein [Antricoccus suffuscus]|uniref:hypothetical protein n=1 Tax=Antricoccus suffuscus TaxID=1629062 RepID=UPI001EDE56DE|nr:hypothetical protein [Antricoccus suffuscus]